MVDFMSSYQTQDTMRGKHYHPYGYLCWYECDSYGDPTGKVYLIKKVPEYVWIFDFGKKGYQKLKKDRERIPPLKEVLSREPNGIPLKTTDAKVKMHQSSHRQDIKAYRKDKEKCRQRKQKTQT